MKHIDDDGGKLYVPYLYIRGYLWIIGYGML